MEELSVRQAAVYRDVTPQAISFAIKCGKLKAERRKNKWIIKLSDLEEYEKNRYDRTLSKINGKIIFDKENGLFSAREAAQLLRCDRQTIYYSLRRKKLHCHKRYKRTWVIHISDIENFRPRMRVYKKKG